MKITHIFGAGSWAFLALGLFLYLFNPQLSHSAFSEFYTEDNDGLTQFSSGSFFSQINGMGFSLVGNSQVDGEPPATYPVESLARFDDSENLLWSVFMDGGEDVSGTELISNPEDTGKFFAGLVEPGLFARIGLFNGSDLTADFAYQLEIQAAQSAKVDLNFFPGELSTVLQDLGSTVQLLVVDSSGDRVFEKSYGSSEFLASDVAFQSTQTAKVSQIPDESGFYISVAKSELNFSTFMFSNTFFLLNVDNAGTLRWSKTFTVDSSFLLIDTSSPGPANSYIYRFFTTNQSTSASSTNLIKFSSAGTLEFSESIENVTLTSQFPDPDQTNLVFSGTLRDPSSLTESDFVIVKMNPTTGAILSQIGIDQGLAESGSVGGEADGQLFGSIISSDDPQFENRSTTLFRLDSNLANPLGVEYSGSNFGGPVTIRSDAELIFSPFSESAGSIGAFSLNTSLSPLVSTCEDFTPITLNTFNPDLTPVMLSVVPSDIAIVAANQTTALVNTTLPLTVLDLTMDACAVSGQVNVSAHPESVAVSVGGTANFSVTAEGEAPISYQWKLDDVDIEGATSNTLQITDVQLSDSGEYTVEITDANGSVVSDAATLTVNTVLAIVEPPEDATINVGDPVIFSVTAQGTGALTYQWIKDDDDIEGKTSASLSINSALESDSGDYQVRVMDTIGSIVSPVATLVVNQVSGITITQQPEKQRVILGGTATFTVVAEGSGTLEYQWYKGDSEIDGETDATLTVSDLELTAAGEYSVVVSEGEDSITSAVVTLTVFESENAGLVSYLESLEIPENQQGEMDDPDGDGVYNIIEYLMGSNASDPSSVPGIGTSVAIVEGEVYFSISYIIDSTIEDLSLEVEFSSSIDFAETLESVLVSTEDLEEGLQRVTVRSVSPIVTGSQFSRLSVLIAP